MKGLSHYEKEERAWGNFERFTLNEQTTVKILTIKSGEALSLQQHKHRDEFGRVLKGSAVVRIANAETDVHNKDTFFIPRNTTHRITAHEEFVYLEISFGNFDEDDEQRIEDNYGRV